MPYKKTGKLLMLFFVLICIVLIIISINIFNGKGTNVNNQVKEIYMMDVKDLIKSGKVTIQEDKDETYKRIRIINQKPYTLLTEDERKTIINYLGQSNDCMTQEEVKIINDYLEVMYGGKKLSDSQIKITTYPKGSLDYENFKKERENKNSVLNKYFY